jgi:hypothetical protein
MEFEEPSSPPKEQIQNRGTPPSCRADWFEAVAVPDQDTFCSVKECEFGKILDSPPGRLLQKAGFWW